VVPLWIRNVISLCNAKGGHITSEEIANIAAVAKRFALGSTLVSQLKRNKQILVEVVGETDGDKGHKVKLYRVTRRCAEDDR
jgi:hypothetical protein